ncbi:Hypothetical predicted protein, partial [Pelobates cultripes]
KILTDAIWVSLHQLLHRDADWCWTEQHAAVDTLKTHLTSPPVLQYFDVHKSVILFFTVLVQSVFKTASLWHLHQEPTLRLKHTIHYLRKHY